MRPIPLQWHGQHNLLPASAKCSPRIVQRAAKLPRYNQSRIGAHRRGLRLISDSIAYGIAAAGTAPGDNPVIGAGILASGHPA
jgi:hypothetical protein